MQMFLNKFVGIFLYRIKKEYVEYNIDGEATIEMVEKRKVCLANGNRIKEIIIILPLTKQQV
jgi:uncharacterized protein YifN (PemK superfamily)